MGRIRVTVHTGFVGANHEDEFDAPEDWDEMTEAEKNRFLGEWEEEAIANTIEAYARYEDG